MKKIKLLILSAIFVSGKMFNVDEEVEVNEREAQELLRRGVAKDIDADEDNPTTKPLERMNKDDLIKYAVELGLEISTEMTKKDIIALINMEAE